MRRTPHQFGRTVAAAALLGAVVASLTACTSGPAAEEDRASAPVADATGASASVASTVSGLTVSPGNVGSFDFGPHAVISGSPIATGDTNASFSSIAAVNGRLVAGTGSTIAAGSDATYVDGAFGAQQEASRAPSFVVATLTHVPASGLTPERYLTTLERFDAGSGTSSETASDSGCASDRCTLDGVTLFGDVAVVSYEVEDVAYVDGVSLTSGRTVWRASGVAPAAVSGSLLLLHGPQDGEADTAPTYAVNGETGARAWTFRDPAGQGATAVARVLDPDYALIKSPAPTSDGAAVYRFSLTNLQTGAVIASRYAFESRITAAYDSIDHRFVWADVAESVAAAEDATWLETLDQHGSVIFRVSPSRYTALGQPRVVTALGGRMWIDGENGTDSVDSKTGSNAVGASGAATPLLTLIDGSVAEVRTGTEPQSPISFVIAPTGSPTEADIASASH